MKGTFLNSTLVALVILFVFLNESATAMENENKYNYYDKSKEEKSSDNLETIRGNYETLNLDEVKNDKSEKLDTKQEKKQKEAMETYFLENNEQTGLSVSPRLAFGLTFVGYNSIPAILMLMKYYGCDKPDEQDDTYSPETCDTLNPAAGWMLGAEALIAFCTFLWLYMQTLSTRYSN